MHGEYVSPEMFNYASEPVLIMAMLGGVNNHNGYSCGSVLVATMPEFLRAVEQYLQLFWGITIIFLMVFMPDGMMGLFHRMISRIAGRRGGRMKRGKRPLCRKPTHRDWGFENVRPMLQLQGIGKRFAALSLPKCDFFRSAR